MGKTYDFPIDILATGKTKEAETSVLFPLK
jgi:hypothetical protein